VPYLNCPTCGLSVRVQAEFLMMRNCPRCIARRGIPIPMYDTPEAVSVALFRRPSVAPEPEARVWDPPPT
jgi:hypothetical protein